MSSHGPDLPIDVDPHTGVWSTDKLPMIYVPRHFFVNNHLAVEKELGVERYSEILFAAGYKSAWAWCEKESVTHGLCGTDVFRHYMKRISQRGWGKFTIEALDMQTGAARIRVHHSVFVCEIGQGAGRKVCQMFAGWFPGSLEWSSQDLGLTWKLDCQEVQCASEGKDDCCVFETRSRVNRCGSQI